MRCNIEAFFTLVRAGLFGRTENADCLLQDGVDWMKIGQLSTEQSVIGLVAEGIETLHGEWRKTHRTPLVPRKWALEFASATLQLEQDNLAMNKFVAELFSRLHRRGIHALLLKGQEVAQCYEKPRWRTCGDVDLLLDEEGYQKTMDFLLPLASQSESEHEYKKHLGLTIGKWLVELHGSLRCGFSSRIDKELDKICHDIFHGGHARAWTNRDVQIPILGKEDDVLYVFIHFLNHFYKGGVGIRQICDWCRLLWSFRNSLDLGYTEARLKAMGLMSEWRAFGMFAVEYLGMPEYAIPFFANDEKWKRKAKRILSYILTTGDTAYKRKMDSEGVSLLTRKVRSSRQRIYDMADHFMIFPLDTLRFFPSILLNGLRQK